MKKILIIIPILLVFFIPVSVSAANFGDINVTIPEALKDTPLPYYVIWDDFDSTYLALSSKPAKINTYNVQNDRIDLYGEFALYTLIDDTWNRISNSNGALPPDKGVSYRNAFKIYHHSNYNLMHDNGELVFQKAPIKVSLKELAKRAKMGAVLEVVAKMVPTVMIAVVGFLGFRKALKMLRTVLQGA